MKKIKKYLKKHLTKERYHHTVGVAYTAMSMAMKYNPQPDNNEFMIKAEIAGLLHDCAKCMDNDKKIRICNKNQISYSKIEAENPAEVARREYQVTDEDILNAITWHTTGRPDMSLLEKIIFVADYIEPSRRPIPELNLIRQLAFTDIDQAVIKILENTLKYLNEKGSPIDDMTQKTYDSYIRTERED